MTLDETHDPARRSWVGSAQAHGSDFPIQNLPYGVFSEDGGPPRIGAAIGDAIFDLTTAESEGLFFVEGGPAFNRPDLNAFMALGPKVWTRLRQTLSDLLCDSARPRPDLLVAQAMARLHLPVFVRSFTDFYASREHATNVGAMFRGRENALLPNWLHMPIGYNGRASTVVVSGTPVGRPMGQLKGPDDAAPRWGASEKLDIELELGAIVGTGSSGLLTTSQADEAIFGYVLLNDWSARDIQVWEYQPLGPFQGKAFATTISPWIVSRDALAPYRVPAPPRDVALLPYLHEGRPNNLDITLEVRLSAGDREKVISRTNARGLYYSSAQQLAHHTSSGCAMCSGDLLGSGTISGPERGSCGSLLEITWNGRDPIDLGGVSRTFLEDGDKVTITGWCEGETRIGFGACEGTILPATGKDA